MRHKFIFLLLLPLSIWAQDQVMLEILSENENPSYHYIKDNPVMMFGNDNLTIRTDLYTVEYPLKSVKKISYYTDFDGVDDVLIDDCPIISLSEDKIILKNITLPSEMNLYNLRGECVMHKLFVEDETATVSMSSLLPGVYIVNIDRFSYKIIKR